MSWLRGHEFWAYYTAYNTSVNENATGDQENHTIYLSRDGSDPVIATNNQDSALHKELAHGEYAIFIEDNEADCDTLNLLGVSTTNYVIVLSTRYEFLRLPNVDPGDIDGLAIVDSTGGVLTSFVMGDVEGDILGDVQGKVRGSGSSTLLNIGVITDVNPSFLNAVWDVQTSLITGTGTIGKLLVDEVPTISDRALSISDRIGAFTGSGLNTILGFFRALFRSDLVTPSDIGGAFDETMSLQGLNEHISRIPEGIAISEDLNYFKFEMVSVIDGRTPVAGLSVVAQRAIDNGAFDICANSVTDIGFGAYKINLASTDLDGDLVMLYFSAGGALPKFIQIKTA